MDYSVRSGDRHELIATLEQIVADRGRRAGRDRERADEAQRGADALRAGADAAHYEGTIYVVGEADRYSVFGGTRAEVEAQLRDGAEGFLHLGNPEVAAEAQDALERVARGDDVVRVGHLLYAVRG